LGNCTKEQISRIVAELDQLALRQSPFLLHLKGLGTFGRPEQPRILWAGVDGGLPALQSLQQQIVKQLTPIGFSQENRPYRPHVTLARKYQGQVFPQLELERFRWDRGDWEVNEIVLYETKLGEQPMYHIVERFPFSL
jgi:2'-5' RNA ligase